jgi:two-component system, response regulator PdtaR
MYALDPKIQARLKQHMSRVLILEANHAYARMLADMLRVLGADNIVIETDDRKGMDMLSELNPHLIITEYKTPNIDGIAFARQLRHSQLKSKAVPIIMVKADITPRRAIAASTRC